MKRIRLATCGLVLWALAPFALSEEALSPKTVLVSGPVPVNLRSQIFGAEDLPQGPAGIGLAAHGYQEEEYFLSGTANVYEYDHSWARRVKQSDVPFTTRVILRYPKNVKAFSGDLQIECEHPQAAASLSWGAIKYYVIDHGDAYASVMCGADLITRKTPSDAQPTGAPFVLKWFDPVRYRPLRWPEDDGIRYDVLAETAAMLRGDAAANPLAAYHVRRVYLSGWSFTGSLIRTYINAGFASLYRAEDGGPLFNGYLIGISASSVSAGMDPLNNDGMTPPKNDPHRITHAMDVPVIELLSENEAVTNDGIQQPDSDNPASRHRLYEVPGLTHGDGLGSHAGEQFQLVSHGYKVTPPAACPLEHSDVPMGALASSALFNMDRWIRTGAAPPRAERMRIDYAKGIGIKDGWGNTLGGVRTAELDVPLARYAEPPASAPPGCQPNPVFHFLAIKRIPAPQVELTKRYGTRQDYLSQYDRRTQQLVAAGWLLPADGESQKNKARKRADTALSSHE